METLLQDLRFGMRMLFQRPGFTAVIILALALGIGANTAIFSVVNAVLLRPLPYAEPERLVQVWEYRPRQNLNQQESSASEYAAWRDQNQVFEQMAAIDYGDYNLTGNQEPERVSGARVSASYFTLLGVKPAFGRTFAVEEDQPDRNNVVVLSHKLWQRRFAADPNIVNQTIMLDGQACTVAGVMPRGFVLPNDSDLAVPIALTAEQQTTVGNHYLLVLARLKPGVTIGQAQAEMTTIAGRLEQTYGKSNLGHGVVLVPLHEQVTGGVRPALLVLLGAVGCVLLIACANVANLLLARATARRKEIAIRTALGAGRMRIVRQLLTESLLLSVIGGALGLLLAMWGVDFLLSLDPDSIPRATEINLDVRVLAFTMGLSVLTGILFGLIPALQASRLELTESLKEGDRGSTESFRRNRTRSVLVVTEVALTLVLLVGAGLLIKSFARLREVNPGFNPSQLLTLQVTLPASKYTERTKVAGFYEQLWPRLQSLPGVEAVGATSVLPLTGDDASNFVTIEGRPPLPAGEAMRAGRRIVNTDFFRAMNIPLKQGRAFANSDTADSLPVAVINETYARRFFPGEDPVGKRIRMGGDSSAWITIVGIVGDVKHNGLDRDARPENYFPAQQSPARSMIVVVRSKGDASALAAPVRAEVLAVDKDQPVGSVKTMDQLLAESLGRRRFNMLLLGVFAGVALVLAAVGLYGVMNYSVTQRTHEIGIRMALGASRGDVLKLIVGQGMTLTLIGVALGLFAAWGLTRLMSSLLFGVSTTDIMTYAGVALVIIAVAFIASFIPARRALRVDPMTALRYE